MHPEKASPFQGRDNLGVVENQQKQKHTLCKCPLCLHLLLLCADFVFFFELVLEPGCCFSHHRNIFSEVFSLFFLRSYSLRLEACLWKQGGGRLPLFVLCVRVFCVSFRKSLACSPWNVCGPGLLSMQPNTVSQTYLKLDEISL